MTLIQGAWLDSASNLCPTTPVAPTTATSMGVVKLFGWAKKEEFMKIS
jgi:hypothetical protein